MLAHAGTVIGGMQLLRAPAIGGPADDGAKAPPASACKFGIRAACLPSASSGARQSSPIMQTRLANEMGFNPWLG